MEAVFRTLKSELNLRPIFHRIQRRVEALILIAFLGYCLWICLKQKLRAAAGSLTPAQVIHSLKGIILVEVWFDLRKGGRIGLPRITQPEAQQQLILHQLGWSLPEQPPPKNLPRPKSVCVDDLRLLGRIRSLRMNNLRKLNVRNCETRARDAEGHEPQRRPASREDKRANPLSTSDPQGRHSSALAERRWRSPLNFRIRADFSSTEPHLDPPILLPTVRGVV